MLLLTAAYTAALLCSVECPYTHTHMRAHTRTRIYLHIACICTHTYTHVHTHTHTHTYIHTHTHHTLHTRTTHTYLHIRMHMRAVHTHTLSKCSLQATKLTKACQKLKRLGHEIRARPFTYHNIKQLELDSFLTYMSSLELSVCTQTVCIVKGVYLLSF